MAAPSTGGSVVPSLDLGAGCGELIASGELRILQGNARELTTFGLGGDLLCLVEPQSLSALQQLLNSCARTGRPWRVLGAGSNIIFPDEPVRDVVVRLPRLWSGEVVCSSDMDILREIPRLLARPDEPGVPPPAAREGSPQRFVFAATPLMTLSRKHAAAGLTGLEFAAGIPATFGGAIRMNAGAHGHQISEVLASVLYVDPRGVLHNASVDSLRFRYRSSDLPHDCIVLGGVVRCLQCSADESMARRASCLEYRKRTQPLTLRSAGSIFRNPSPVELLAAGCSEGSASAGWLIEQSGLKGERRGGVEFSRLHANWLVRTDSAEARAADARELIVFAQQRVHERFGVLLEPEVLLW